jgi:hypothetical protein
MKVQLTIGQVLAARIGTEKRSVLFYRITERNGDKIRLQPLITGFTVKGNPFPLDVDRTQKTFLRTVINDYGSESVHGIVIGPLACGLRPWYSPKNLMGRGGHRVGAGRKKGGGKGRNSVTVGITMTKEEWLQIEETRGSTGRSEFIRNALFPLEKKFEKPIDG